MAYQVIARRYRPQRFQEVVGQEAVGETLRRAISDDRLAHAYLFAGPRGVGKTSMARIFAKALNCPETRDGEPCQTCDICRAIAAGEDLDVVELDAASHRGIDDVRDIIGSVSFAPGRAPYKIFIVDEVHMLTREAFNALLKTLEEPPDHVKFVFATTEPQKIPETVASRCQRFDFRPISERDVVRRLEQICQAEGARPEEGVLERIARYARGGMRDAQSLLDQLITLSGVEPTATDLDRLAGRLGARDVEALLEAIQARDPAAVWRRAREALDRGVTPEVLLEEVLFRLREAIVGALAAGGDTATLTARAAVIHDAIARIRLAPFPEILAELALLEIAHFDDLRPVEEILERLEALRGGGGPAPPAPPPFGGPGAGGGSGPAGGRTGPSGPAAPGQDPAPPGAGPAPPPAGPEDARRLRNLWPSIAGEVGGVSPVLGTLLAGSRIAGTTGGEAVVEIANDNALGLKKLSEPRGHAIVEGTAERVTGRRWRLRFRSQAPGDGPAPQASDGEAPDPLVRKSIEIFRGRPV